MARDLHSEITARILEALRRGVVPWRKPWSTKGAGQMPRNGATDRAYSGVNVPLLWLTADERGYTDNRWMTFKQALELGGAVRKGERGTTVVFVSTLERADEKTGEPVRIPYLKAYSVFNVAQLEGVNLDAAAPAIVADEQRDELADEFIAATGASLTHGEGRAYYRPSTDVVNLPPFATFETASAYYSTAFHELTHWTGAPHRLDRTKGKSFGDREYAFEELVAELGAAFLCAEFGYDNDQLEQSAAYIESWTRALELHPKLFVSAASNASRAVEFMRGLAIAEPAGAPAAAAIETPIAAPIAALMAARQRPRLARKAQDFDTSTLPLFGDAHKQLALI